MLSLLSLHLRVSFLDSSHIFFVLDESKIALSKKDGIEAVLGESDHLSILFLVSCTKHRDNILIKLVQQDRNTYNHWFRNR